MAQGLGTRDYLIEEYTKALCPLCHESGSFRSDDPGVFKDAMLVQHSGKIWMRRFCQKHGEVESLYEEHADLWKSRDGWSTPTSPVTPDRADNYAAFPDGYRDGLPAGHGQHTCILLLNITQHCNYKCPTCYASALEPGTKRSSVEYPLTFAKLLLASIISPLLLKMMIASAALLKTFSYVVSLLLIFRAF